MWKSTLMGYDLFKIIRRHLELISSLFSAKREGCQETSCSLNCDPDRGYVKNRLGCEICECVTTQQHISCQVRIGIL